VEYERPWPKGKREGQSTLSYEGKPSPVANAESGSRAAGADRCGWERVHFSVTRESCAPAPSWKSGQSNGSLANGESERWRLARFGLGLG
jgi:hypothetical protein